jgi:hypothetical protein
MAIVAPVARVALVTTCRALTTGGSFALSPGVIFLGLAALGAVGFLAYRALRSDYEVSIAEAGVGPLKLKGIHISKSGGPRTGKVRMPQDLAVAYQREESVLMHR